MKSVGEVLSLGRSFAEAFGKALSGARARRPPRGAGRPRRGPGAPAPPSADRYDLMLWALEAGATVDDLVLATGVDPWFCGQLAEIVAARDGVRGPLRRTRRPGALRAARRAGLTDRDVAAAVRVGRARRGPPPPRARGPSDLPRRRHLRRRVRRPDPVLLRGLRDRGRGAAGRPAGPGGPRLRAQPHRPGDRVRLLLRARRRDARASWATPRSWSTATRRPSPRTTA